MYHKYLCVVLFKYFGNIWVFEGTYLVSWEHIVYWDTPMINNIVAYGDKDL